MKMYLVIVNEDGTEHSRSEIPQNPGRRSTDQMPVDVQGALDTVSAEDILAVA